MVIEVRNPFKRVSKSDQSYPAIKLTDGNLFYSYFAGLFGTEGSQSMLTIAGQMNAYSLCAPVNTVINKQADALKTGRFQLTDDAGNEVKVKDKYLAQFLTRPNPTARVYSKIHGIAYCLPVYGLSRLNPLAFYVVPNFMVTPKYSRKLFGQTELNEIIEGYDIQGIEQTVKPEDLLIFRDTSINTSVDWNQLMIPQSRLVPLEDQVNSIISALGGWLAISKRKGIPLGIISSSAKDSTSSIPLTETEKQDAHDQLNSAYGMSDTQRKFIISTASLSYTPISLPVSDLMILEGIEANSRHICTQYNFPFGLLGYSNSSALQNGGEKKEDKKELYTSCVIPDAESMCETITEWWGMQGYSLQVFFDHLEIFQKGKQETAMAISIIANGLSKLWRDGAITFDEYRLQLSEIMTCIDPAKPLGTQYFTNGNQNQINTGTDQGTQEAESTQVTQSGNN